MDPIRGYYISGSIRKIVEFTDEMVDQCEDHTNGLYQSLIVHLNLIKSTNSELARITVKIENLFIAKTREDVQFVFSTAVDQGIEIGK